MSKSLAIFLLGIQIVIFAYFVVVNSIYTLFAILSIKELLKNLKISTERKIRNIISSKAFYRPISLIVAAFNEEETIVANVKNLLNLHFPEYEIVVINDGSTDKTLNKLINNFNLIPVPPAVRIVLPHRPIKQLFISLDYPNLIVVDKENGGKADAINCGINISQYPLFCCIDADSILDPDALLRASRIFFENKEVIATGGVVLPLNGCTVEGGIITEVRTPKKNIENFQCVEYTRGFLAGRTGWSFFGILLIISGAFGIFRKDMVIEIGGYRKTVGEDMDLVVRLHKFCREKRIKYKILFIPDPVCYTQVPADWKSLIRQRNRWHRGLIDSLWFSRRMFLNPKYGSVGLYAYPYYTLVEALGPIVEFIGYFAFVLFYIFGLLSKEFALLFFFLAFVWGMCINIASVFLDNFIYRRYERLKDVLKLVLFGIFEFFGYRQLIAFERMLATFQFWRKTWGKPKRKKIKETYTDLYCPP